MPELKHNFLKGRMNKDLDERLVPDGEYRDALNIEVSTSEDSNVGSVQTTMGNIKISDIPSNFNTKCVGSIVNDKEDKIYWLISNAGTQPSPTGLTSAQHTIPEYGDYYISDIIAEYDYKTDQVKPVVVDVFYTTVDITQAWYPNILTDPDVFAIMVGSQYFDSPGNISNMHNLIYEGMQVECVNTIGTSFFPPNTFVTGVESSSSTVYLSNPPIAPLSGPLANYRIRFRNYNRALGFFNSSFITGINIVDDMLFWTDNLSEPRKINIKRSLEERQLNPFLTPPTQWLTHSLLAISDTVSTIPDALKIATDPLLPSYPPLPPTDKYVSLKEDHAVVIRKSPEILLNLEMQNSASGKLVEGDLKYSLASPPVNPFFDNNGEMKDTAWVEFGGPSSPINPIPITGPGYLANGVPYWNLDDMVVFNPLSDPNLEIICKVLGGPDPAHGSYYLDIISFSDNINSTHHDFLGVLIQGDPLFEFKMPRFAYRYKYEDGEYSAFSPFTEIAFLPDEFEYHPKKGYNLGMTNNLRYLALKDFVDDKRTPPDVFSIDILYKESNSASVYTVKTIKRDDFEWNAISENQTATGRVRGYLKLDTDLIHALVPSNQLLRPWDNVPRKALAQEVTKNRIVYGNYLQNYDISNSRKQEPNIKIDLSLSTLSYKAAEFVNMDDWLRAGDRNPEQVYSDTPYLYDPSKSIKTLRTYQLGVIYRDKYGRETPVFSNTSKKSGGETDTASIYIEKHLADKQTKLRAQIKSTPPEWAETFKFFIKETANEYYNLAMDRWYDAQDDNIWLSFPSSERNKVDIETFLILKKEKDKDDFVAEKARYKILAIDNEAPDFIKTSNTGLGTIQDTAAGDLFHVPGSAVGVPRSGVNYIYVLATEAVTAGWPDSLLVKGVAGASLQISSQTNRSNWYKIKSVIKGISGGSYWRIDIIEQEFGQEMDFTHTNPSSPGTSMISGLRITINRGTVENLPEFDGRFFVKIYKDQLIIDKVIKPSLDAVEYRVIDARQVGYIDTATNHSLGSFNNATQRKDYFGNYTWSWKYWRRANAGQTPASGSTLLPGNQRYQTVGSDTWSGHTRAETSQHYHDFWGPRGGWFIDRSPMHKWYRQPHNTDTQPWDTGCYAGQPHCANHSTGYGFGIGTYGPGAGGDGFGMSLSFTNMGDYCGSSPNTHPGLIGVTDIVKHDHNTNKWWDDLRAEVEFINNLTTNGTLWRWMEDPNQHIYKTSSVEPRICGVNAAHHYLTSNSNWYRSCDWYFNYNHRTRYNFYYSRLKDGGGMGSPCTGATLANVVDGSGNPIPGDARYRPDTSPNLDPWYDANGDFVSPLPITPAPGLRADFGVCDQGSYANNTINCSPANSSPWDTAPNSSSAHTAHPNLVTLQILTPIVISDLEKSSTNPAIWETEPKENIGLDIYHEIGQVYPVELNDKTNEMYAPLGSTVLCWRSSSSSWVTQWTLANPHINFGPSLLPPLTIPTGTINLGATLSSNWKPPIVVSGWDGNKVLLKDSNGLDFPNDDLWPNEMIVEGDFLEFLRPDGSRTSAWVTTTTDGSNVYELGADVHNRTMTLPWFNCYSFGNGVESDRIRDDFNQVTIDNGPKASTTLEEPYQEERRKSGLIYSGIYNSTSGVNNLNQFIQGEKITKDLNPVYGSIQKLHTRDTNLVTLCEDKVLKILANKDALFNADGNTNVTATSNVLGQTTPFAGEYGISKNPESFASESFRAYFADKQRGVILRLSQDGLTPISDQGMKDYFADTLPNSTSLIGSYDEKKSAYNLTIKDIFLGEETNMETMQTSRVYESKTLSFAEKVKGWSSFKSFIPEYGVSLNNKYYTFKSGQLWRHHEESVERNSFYSDYGSRTDKSHVTFLFNQKAESVKSFGTLNYEGTQARITANLSDNEYYNNQNEVGWWVESLKTNLQEANELEFKGKEGKWFSQIKGVSTSLQNLDTREFSAQGIDEAIDVTIGGGNVPGCMDPVATNYDPNATIDDGSCIYPDISWDCVPGGYQNDSCDGKIDQTPSFPLPTPPQAIHWISQTAQSEPSGNLKIYTTDPTVMATATCLKDFPKPGGAGIITAGAIHMIRVGFVGEIYQQMINIHESTYTNWFNFTQALAGATGQTIPATGSTSSSIPTYEDVETFITAANTHASLTITYELCECSGFEPCHCVELPNLSGQYTTESLCMASCCDVAWTFGCTDPNANNYDPTAQIDDGSCVYDCEQITQVFASSSPQTAVQNFSPHAFPNNETGVEAIVFNFGSTADFRDYKYLRADWPFDEKLTGCTGQEKGECCDEGEILTHGFNSFNFQSVTTDFYLRHNPRVRHISIDYHYGYAKWYYSWKDYIDDALSIINPVTMNPYITDPTWLYDIANAGTTVFGKPVPSGWVFGGTSLSVFLDSSGYNRHWVIVSMIIQHFLPEDPNGDYGSYGDRTATTECCDIDPPVRPTWNCTTNPSLPCVDPGDGTGTYHTLGACLAACTPPPLRWDCVDGLCLQTNASGQYPDYTTCAAACGLIAWICAEGNNCTQVTGSTSQITYPTLAACQAACIAPALCPGDWVQLPDAYHITWWNVPAAQSYLNLSVQPSFGAQMINNDAPYDYSNKSQYCEWCNDFATGGSVPGSFNPQAQVWQRVNDLTSSTLQSPPSPWWSNINVTSGSLVTETVFVDETNCVCCENWAPTLLQYGTPPIGYVQPPVP